MHKIPIVNVDQNSGTRNAGADRLRGPYPTKSAPHNPTYIPIPPKVGVGSACELLEFGISRTLSRTMQKRTVAVIQAAIKVEETKTKAKLTIIAPSKLGIDLLHLGLAKLTHR